MAVHVITVGSNHNIYSLTSTVVAESASAMLDPDFRKPRVEFIRNSVINKLSSLGEQEICLQSAASVAHLPFDPTEIENCGYTAMVKMNHAYSSSDDSESDFTGESSGLSYGLSLALLCAKHSGMYDYEQEKAIPVFATGRLPQGGGSVLQIQGLQAKFNFVCDYMASNKAPRSHVQNWRQDEGKPPAFYFFYPKGNLLSPSLDGSDESAAVTASWQVLTERLESLNGKLVGISSLKEAVSELLEARLKTQLDSDATFPGIKPILWQDRHLYRGRKLIIDDLEQKALSAYNANNILAIEGTSGSGKSSIILGGLAERLVYKSSFEEAQPNFHPPRRITPASYDNLNDLLKALLSDITEDEATLNHWLKNGVPEQLVKRVNAYLNEQAEPAPRPYLWVIDQAEEFFTHSLYPLGVADKLNGYLTALATDIDVLIISINRIEYSQDIPWVKASTDTRVYVKTPDSTEMGDLIEQQVKSRGLALESTSCPKPLRARMADDVAAMPLTTVGTLLKQMHELKEQYDPSGELLKHDYYEEVGQAQGAMAHLAEKALQDADNRYRENNPHADDDQVNQLHHCLFELFVGINEDGSPITLAPAKQQINDYTNANELWRYIDTFRNHGLIVEYGWGKVPRYKFAHDTLISGIELQEESSAYLPEILCWQEMKAWFLKNRSYLSAMHNLDVLISHSSIESGRDESEDESHVIMPDRLYLIYVGYMDSAHLQPGRRIKYIKKCEMERDLRKKEKEDFKDFSKSYFSLKRVVADFIESDDELRSNYKAKEILRYFDKDSQESPRRISDTISHVAKEYSEITVIMDDLLSRYIECAKKKSRDDYLEFYLNSTEIVSAIEKIPTYEESEVFKDFITEGINFFINNSKSQGSELLFWQCLDRLFYELLWVSRRSSYEDLEAILAQNYHVFKSGAKELTTDEFSDLFVGYTQHYSEFLLSNDGFFPGQAFKVYRRIRGYMKLLWGSAVLYLFGKINKAALKSVFKKSSIVFFKNTSDSDEYTRKYTEFIPSWVYLLATVLGALTVLLIFRLSEYPIKSESFSSWNYIKYCPQDPPSSVFKNGASEIAYIVDIMSGMTDFTPKISVFIFDFINDVDASTLACSDSLHLAEAYLRLSDKFVLKQEYVKARDITSKAFNIINININIDIDKSGISNSKAVELNYTLKSIAHRLVWYSLLSGDTKSAINELIFFDDIYGTNDRSSILMAHALNASGDIDQAENIYIKYFDQEAVSFLITPMYHKTSAPRVGIFGADVIKYELNTLINSGVNVLIPFSN